MSTPKGYPSQKKDERLKSEFTTVQPVGENRYALDVVVSMYNQIVVDGATIDAVITQQNGDIYSITVNNHGAKVGDLVYFKNGSLVNRQIRVWDVPDINTIILSETFSSGDPQPSPGDEIDILSPIQPRTNADGDLIVQPGPTKFVLDGVTVDVEEDTVTPANNKPLPVKLTGLTGDINITANDLNVQLDHSNDSVKIGDGTDFLEINADGSLNITDNGGSLTVDASQLDIDDLDHSVDSVKLGDGTVLFTAGRKSSANSFPVVLSDEQEAYLDGLEGILTTIDVDTGNLVSLTTSIDNKTPTLGQKAEVGSVPVALATEQDALLVSLEAKDFATQTTLAALLTELELKANLSETQPVSVASLPLPTGAATETTLVDIYNELQLKADLTETQPVSAASLPLPTGAATEATLATIDGVLDSIKIDTGNIDTSLNNIESNTTPLDVVETASSIIDLNGQNDSTWTQLVASTSSAIKKAAIFMSSGRVLEFGVGAAASEVRKFVVAPGGYPGQAIEVSIPAATRISYRFVSGEGTGGAGERAVINWMG